MQEPSPPLLAADGAVNAADRLRGKEGSLSRKKASGGRRDAPLLGGGINFAPSVFPGKERILFPKQPLCADASYTQYGLKEIV